MKKYLKIIAIVLLVVGIGGLVMTGIGYTTFVTRAMERTDASQQALEEAVAKGEKTEEIEKLTGYLKSNLRLEAQAKQKIIPYAAGGIVSLIIGVVLWFVSRKKSDDTKEIASESEQAT